MPLPLIPVVFVLAGGTALGAGAGGKGVHDMTKARKTAKRASDRQEAAIARHAAAEAKTQDHLSSYGLRQAEVQREVLGAWAAWLEANERKVRRMPRQTVKGARIPEVDLPELQRLAHEGELLKGGTLATVSGIVAQQAALGGVRAAAAASTGTAISSLSGAAAESATLAWLGGGTLATGGGGVAAGGAVLSGVAVAPAVLIAGITLAIQGEKARTSAVEFTTDVDRAVAEMKKQRAMLKRLRTRVDEVRGVLDQLADRALAALADLTELDFDPDRDLEAFQRTALLMAEVGRVLEVRLVDEDGNVSDESFHVVEEYAA